MEEHSIRIGKISREVEKGLKVSLTSDIHLYVAEATLNRMAACHPDDYLKILEKVKRLIQNADFVRMEKRETYLEYARVYFREAHFYAMVVRFQHEGTPKRWVLRSLMSLENFQEVQEGFATPFRRIPPKEKKRPKPQS
ncbi:MAG: hypothetical protein ACI32C_02595 [Candidatus Enteromonas sp.]